LPTDIGVILTNIEELQEIISSISRLQAKELFPIQQLLNESGHVALRIQSVSCALSLLEIRESEILEGIRPLRLVPYVSRIMPWIVYSSTQSGTGIHISDHLKRSDPVLLVDRSFEHALYCLLDNAVRYSAIGTSAILTWQEDEKKGVLTLRNIGIPLPSWAERPRMYELGYRFSKACKCWTGGYGIGLAVASHILEMHGFTLHANSSENPVASRNIFILRLMRALRDSEESDNSLASESETEVSSQSDMLLEIPTSRAEQVALSTWRGFASNLDDSIIRFLQKRRMWGEDAKTLYREFIASPLYHVQFDVEVPKEMIQHDTESLADRGSTTRE